MGKNCRNVPFQPTTTIKTGFVVNPTPVNKVVYDKPFSSFDIER
jgi:hypothetical protein